AAGPCAASLRRLVPARGAGGGAQRGRAEPDGRPSALPNGGDARQAPLRPAPQRDPPRDRPEYHGGSFVTQPLCPLVGHNNKRRAARTRSVARLLARFGSRTLPREPLRERARCASPERPILAPSTRSEWAYR